jgi:hypothetical protein
MLDKLKNTLTSKIVDILLFLLKRIDIEKDDLTIIVAALPTCFTHTVNISGTYVATPELEMVREYFKLLKDIKS